MRNNKTRWLLVAVVAAVIAAATTALVLILRARAKKRAWYEEEAFDYDLDDCECFDLNEDNSVLNDEIIDEIIE